MTDRHPARLLLVLAAVSTSCDRSDSSEQAPAASTSANEPAKAIEGAPAPLESSRHESRPETSMPLIRSAARTCRAIAVRGKVERVDGGAQLRSGDALDDEPWLALGEKAQLLVKHARSGRELTFRGPATIQPCHDQAEHFLVHTGEVTTTPGIGARPGAEVLISTPLGVVRYGDAQLKAVASDKRLKVSVQRGTAWVEGREPEPAPEEVTEGGSTEREEAAPDVKMVIEQCESAARNSDGKARAVLNRNAEQRTLGRRAAEHLRARQAARRACGIAAASLGGKPGHDYAQRLEKADRLWQRVPHAADSP